MYRKVNTGYWKGKLARRIRGDMDAHALAFYLLSNPHGNMIGLYWMPLDYAAMDLGISIERVEAAMEKLSSPNRMEQSGSTSKVIQVDPGFVLYDFESDWAFIREAARHEFGDDPNPDDKRNGSLWRCLGSTLEECRGSAVGKAFIDKYGEKWGRILEKSGVQIGTEWNRVEVEPLCSTGFPSDPDPDSDPDSDPEQEKDPGTGEGSKIVEPAGSSSPALPGSDFKDPKKSAAARIREKDPTGDVQDAVEALGPKAVPEDPPEEIAAGEPTGTPSAPDELVTAQKLGDLLNRHETNLLAATIRRREENPQEWDLASYRGKKFDEPARRIERTALYAELYFRLRDSDGDDALDVLRHWRAGARRKGKKNGGNNWCSDVIALQNLLTERDPVRLRDGLEMAAVREWMSFEWDHFDNGNGRGRHRHNLTGKPRDVEADEERVRQGKASQQHLMNQQHDPDDGELYDAPGTWPSEIKAAKAAAEGESQ